MTRRISSGAHKKRRSASLSTAAFDSLIEEVTVDAHGRSEQTVRFCTMLEQRLAVPFNTNVLGAETIVEGVELTEDDRIVAVCTRGRSRQRIAILDLPIPTPPPDGAE